MMRSQCLLARGGRIPCAEVCCYHQMMHTRNFSRLTGTHQATWHHASTTKGSAVSRSGSIQGTKRVGARKGRAVPVRSASTAYNFHMPTMKEEKPKSSVMPRSLLCGCLSKAAVERVVDRAATAEDIKHHDSMVKWERCGQGGCKRRGSS